MSNGTSHSPARDGHRAERSAPGRGKAALVIGGGDLDAMVTDRVFASVGLVPRRARSIEEARGICGTAEPAIVVMPLRLDGEPLEAVLSNCQTRKVPPPVIVIAHHDEINDAAAAIRAGAVDCLFAPFTEHRLARVLRDTLETRDGDAPASATSPAGGTDDTDDTDGAAPATEARAQASQAQTTARQGTPPPTDAPAPPALPAFQGLIGRSATMTALFARLEAIAPSTAPVLLLGESGSGKTSIARALHRASPRAEGPFESCTCAALPPDGDPDAILRRAPAGTLFLDRVEDMPPPLAARFLAALHRFETEPEANRPRLVSSLNIPPTRAFAEGLLRRDVYFALNVIELTLPPLRARGHDLADLFRAMLARAAAQEGRDAPRLTRPVLDRLAAHSWPGNLRELANVARSLVLTAAGRDLAPSDLPASLYPGAPAALVAPPGADPPSDLVGRTLGEIERSVIEATIAAQGGSIPRAARVLDVSPSTIYRKRETWETPRK